MAATIKHYKELIDEYKKKGDNIAFIQFEDKIPNVTQLHDFKQSTGSLNSFFQYLDNFIKDKPDEETIDLSEILINFSFQQEDVTKEDTKQQFVPEEIIDETSEHLIPSKEEEEEDEEEQIGYGEEPEDETSRPQQQQAVQAPIREEVIVASELKELPSEYKLIEEVSIEKINEAKKNAYENFDINKIRIYSVKILSEYYEIFYGESPIFLELKQKKGEKPHYPIENKRQIIIDRLMSFFKSNADKFKKQISRYEFKKQTQQSKEDIEGRGLIFDIDRLRYEVFPSKKKPSIDEGKKKLTTDEEETVVPFFYTTGELEKFYNELIPDSKIKEKRNQEIKQLIEKIEKDPKSKINHVRLRKIYRQELIENWRRNIIGSTIYAVSPALSQGLHNRRRTRMKNTIQLKSTYINNIKDDSFSDCLKKSLVYLITSFSDWIELETVDVDDVYRASLMLVGAEYSEDLNELLDEVAEEKNIVSEDLQSINNMFIKMSGFNLTDRACLMYQKVEKYCLRYSEKIRDKPTQLYRRIKFFAK